MNSNMLSQEEIDALLNGDIGDTKVDDTKVDDKDIMLTEEEVDALGEIGNISMGTAATTLFTLLGQKVLITTPKVSTTSMKKLSQEYPSPYVAVDVSYKVGLEGSNVLILKTNDVKVITDLMMGGDGTNTDRELSEMDLSAISEAMNQMVGSSSTSLSEIFSKKIDIDPPKAFEIKFDENINDIEIFNTEDELIKISFKMIIGDLVDSEIMQLIPIEFAKELVSELFKNDSDEDVTDIVDDKEWEEDYSDTDSYEEVVSDINYSVRREEAKVKEKPRQAVNVKKFEFNNFDNKEKAIYNESIDLVQDIPIEITVELGRTTKKISEILEYGPGTIIELDKLVGESLEIMANGRVIAKGEVVVIDDNFGVRITDIVNPSKRLKKL
ncbi:flagellar motor switch phosphatase FliY [Clostridium sp. D2Q-11]|uniref:Flagellar motor switch phosphatase FliY n=1 Tax=Anaeromonas frigoriresistens TaxID=2683708 RepID=A0A942Z7T0_9FIRM|nr:flagellar motor switch phosphatase FliY [Anaeromonas frigoriresistens]MBS4539856.1 flagellar motor switch phosphatase FliY [Anaeromonas frigoriresistens]